MARHTKRPSSQLKPISPGYRSSQPQSGRVVRKQTRPTHAYRVAHARADRQFRTYDTSYIMPKRRSKLPVIVGALLALAVVAVAAFVVVPRLAGSSDPRPVASAGSAIIVVKEGDSAKTVGETLADANLVSSAGEFADRVKALGADAAIIPGTYEFSGGMTVDQIIEALRVGPAATADTLAVPEGLTREAIATRVEEATGGRVTAQQFLDASADASVYAGEFQFLADAGGNSLEGFLFPKTYTVTAADDAKAIVRMMLRQFQTEISTLSFSYPETEGLSVYDAVNLASIVEKEAAADNRAMVASVFYNRLSSSRPYLESDATTAYEFGGDPTPEQVHASTPYSTYTNPGLPPTPICSPGFDSLSAVCSPEETSYLFFYFVPNDAGGMDYYFSETYEEHQAAIANG